ncbi:cyclohexadienyl dehydratase [Enterovibrio coralii]|uniref:50S ribosomal protein L7/L12 n=2 Tax=Enterovibrio coralii TaxID=294935 RepID=A0A135IDP0_9GAMM|nr:cyclohexadienyl dehydratase [Enterovibrio coralii]
MKASHLIATVALSLSSFAVADQLDDILEAGVIRVGTTGDYKPFSFYDGEIYSGYDVDVAQYLGEQLGVKVEFVPTTWKGLLDGLKEDKYDIAMGGITRRMQRQLNAEQTQGYMVFGKCFLVAKGNAGKYDTLEKVNTPSVRVGVNIGGTNEKFAEANLPNATFTKFENNLDVPKAVAAGDVDVMVTETPEGFFYEVTDAKLEASRCDDPFTRSQFGYLIPKGEQGLLNAVNFAIDEMKLKGIETELMQKNQLVAEPKFEVVLVAADGNKVALIQAVKDATGLSLIESKTVVEQLPKVLKENMAKGDAEKMAAALKEAGATIEIKPVQ